MKNLQIILYNKYMYGEKNLAGIYIGFLFIWYLCVDFILFNQYCLTNKLANLLIIFYIQLFYFATLYLNLILYKKNHKIILIFILLLISFFFNNQTFNIIPFLGFFVKSFSYNLSLVGVVFLTGDLTDVELYNANISSIVNNLNDSFNFLDLKKIPFQALYNNLGFVEKPPNINAAYDLASLFSTLINPNKPQKLSCGDQILKDFPELCLSDIKTNEFKIFKKPFNDTPPQEYNFSLKGFDPVIVQKRTLFIYEEIGPNGGRTGNFFVKTYWHGKANLFKVHL